MLLTGCERREVDPGEDPTKTPPPPAAANETPVSEPPPKATETEPSSPLAELLKEAKQHYQKGEHREAIAAYTNALELDPKQPKIANIYNNRGRSHKDDRRAIEDFDIAIRLAPKDQRGYFARSAAHYRLGHIQQSLDDANRFVELAPDDFQGRVNRAISLADLGSFDEAIRDYTRAMELDPKNRPVVYDRGRIRFLKGEYAKVEAEIRDNEILMLATIGASEAYRTGMLEPNGFQSPTLNPAEVGMLQNRFTRDRQGRDALRASWRVQLADTHLERALALAELTYGRGDARFVEIVKNAQAIRATTGK